MKLVRTVSHDHDTLALRARTGLSHEGAQDALAGRASSHGSDQIIGTRLKFDDVGELNGRVSAGPHPVGKPPAPAPVHPVHPIKPPAPKPPVSHPTPISTPIRPSPVSRPVPRYDADAGLGGRFSK